MKKLLQEHKIFKIIIFAVVLLIPVIYSFFYLKSYWDPYGNLKDIQVGIVNLDEGKRGSELITSLKEAENTLGFTEINSDDALVGLGEDKYYAVITIPADFTSSLESAKEENKQKAVITFTPNKRKNYLSYQIINSGLKTAELQLQAKVAAEVADTMAGKLKEVPDSLDEIVDGAGQIEDGANRLSSGLTELSDGVNTLDSKYTEFDNGIKSAKDGSDELANGLTTANEGINTLTEGANNLDNGVGQINDALTEVKTDELTTLTNGIAQLNAGSGELKAGVDSYVAGVNQYISGVDSYEDGVKTLVSLINAYDATGDASTWAMIKYAASGLSSASADDSELNLGGNALKASSANAQKLMGGASAVEAGTEALKTGTAKLQNLGDKLGLLKFNLNKVKDGTSQLKNGTSVLQSGTSKIEDGAYTLSNGLGTLSTNSTTIKDALTKLDDGAKSALDGSKQLADGVNTLKTSVEEGKETAAKEVKKLDGMKEFVEDPVEFKEESFGEVESYGVAFTPLFLSIGLWVGALMLYVVLYYDQRHRFGIFDSNFKNKILQNLAYIGVGAIEGIATGLILKVLLGFNVVSMGGFLIECIWVGITFTMIMQFLIRNFGDIGKFLSLIILVLQLAASGGTFPVETIDKGFQAFTSWLPMTYSVNIFRDCLIQTDASLIGKNTVVLIIVFFVLFALNLIIEFIKRNKEEVEAESAEKTEK